MATVIANREFDEQSQRKRKHGSGNKLNMVIAKTHRFSSRLVGMQLTSGSLIGVILSMCQMSLGFVFLTAGMTNGLWYMVAMVVVIGCALAILIERLSMGGLAAVRENTEDLRRWEDDFYAKVEGHEPTAWELENRERKTKGFKRGIFSGWCFGIVGMTLSTLVGDMFWRQIFAPLGGWQSTGMSLACASVIGLTFVHSELFKSMLDKVLKAILRDMTLMKTAVAVEEQNMQLDMMVSAMETVREDDEVRDPVEGKISRIVSRRLLNAADSISDVSIEEERNTVEGSLVPKQLGGPKSAYAQHKDELGRLLRANPNISMGDLASHFSKPRSTVQGWVNRLKQGV
jgi:hypothetical protein